MQRTGVKCGGGEEVGRGISAGNAGGQGTLKMDDERLRLSPRLRRGRTFASDRYSEAPGTQREDDASTCDQYQGHPLA